VIKLERPTDTLQADVRYRFYTEASNLSKGALSQLSSCHYSLKPSLEGAVDIDAGICRLPGRRHNNAAHRPPPPHDLATPHSY
jgi:hypothetical protein